MFTLSTFYGIIVSTKAKGGPTLNSGYHHGDLRAELIREGLLILDREGCEGLSLRKVAKACGVSQTAPYRHFKDKNELILAIVEQAMQAFNQSLADAAGKHDDPRLGLKEMGVAYVRFFVENPEYLRFLFFTDPELKKEIELCAQDAHFESGHPFATFYEAVKRYREAYPDRDAGQDELVLLCWGLVHGIAALIANKAMPYGGDPIALAEKILWDEKFL
jgi:AcrR family transcriptional regulator